MGDALLSISLIRHLKLLAPEDKVIFVCRPGVGAFFSHYKIADEVIELDKKSKDSILWFRRRMSEESLRYLLVAHQSPRSTWLLRGIKAEKRVSYSQWWNAPFYHARVKRPMHLPEPLRLLALLAPLDAGWAKRFSDFAASEINFNPTARASLKLDAIALPNDIDMRVKPDPDVVAQVTKYLKRPYVAVAPSSQWPTKRWLESGFAELAQSLLSRGYNIYFVGSEHERKTCEDIARATINQTQLEVKSVAGAFDLIALHAFLSQAELVVANDSGSMHMAVVADRPVVSIFGPTVLEQGYRPWSEKSFIVQAELNCRPCGQHGHLKCPQGHHNCMKMITASHVMKGIDNLRSL